MRLLVLWALLLLLPGLEAAAQLPSQEPDIKLPSGKSQKEAILKADHEKSLEDAAKLLQLSEEVQAELEKNDRHIVSLGTLKKLNEMEKLVKRIRSRLKRY